MPLSTITETEWRYATKEEGKQLMHTFQKMSTLLFQDKLQQYLAARAEVEWFYALLRQRAAHRKKLTSCLLPTKERPISCSVPSAPSCPQTLAPLPSSC